MDYKVGDRVRMLGKSAGTLSLAGALVRVTRINVEANANKIAVLFEGKEHVMPKNIVDYYIPNIGDRVIIYPTREEVVVTSVDSTEFHADNGDVYPCRDIIEVTNRAERPSPKPEQEENTMKYEIGDRVQIRYNIPNFEISGKVVKILNPSVGGGQDKLAVSFDERTHLISKVSIKNYIPSIGDIVKVLNVSKNILVSSSGSAYCYTSSGETYPNDTITEVIHRAERPSPKPEQGDTMDYKVGDRVLIGYASEVPSKLRGKTVEVANEKLDGSIIVNAEGIRYTILVSYINYYIPNVGDIVNTEEQSGISVTSVDLPAFQDIDGNLYLARNIRRVVSRAPKSPIIKDGDIVEPIDTERFSDIPRKVGLVSNGLLLFQGNSKRYKSSDFRLSTRVLLEGLVAITDEGHTYLLYDNLAFVDVLKDKYFITCLILPQMLNGATEVEYVKHGLHTEITFSNKGTKLDGSVKAVISYLNSIITG